MFRWRRCHVKRALAAQHVFRQGRHHFVQAHIRSSALLMAVTMRFFTKFAVRQSAEPGRLWHHFVLPYMVSAMFSGARSKENPRWCRRRRRNARQSVRGQIGQRCGSTCLGGTVMQETAAIRCPVLQAVRVQRCRAALGEAKTVLNRLPGKSIGHSQLLQPGAGFVAGGAQHCHGR